MPKSSVNIMHGDIFSIMHQSKLVSNANYYCNSNVGMSLSPAHLSILRESWLKNQEGLVDIFMTMDRIRTVITCMHMLCNHAWHHILEQTH